MLYQQLIDEPDIDRNIAETELRSGLLPGTFTAPLLERETEKKLGMKTELGSFLDDRIGPPPTQDPARSALKLLQELCNYRREALLTWRHTHSENREPTIAQLRSDADLRQMIDNHADRRKVPKHVTHRTRRKSMTRTKDGRIILLSILSRLIPPACYRQAAAGAVRNGIAPSPATVTLTHVRELLETTEYRLEIINDFQETERDIKAHFDWIRSERDDAVEQLIQANTRLVMGIVRNYLGRGMDSQDLFMEGSLGLLTATGKYNYRMGWKFSTYATWWIRQAVSKSLADYEPIRLPNNIRADVAKVYNARYDLENGIQQPPTDETVATILGWSPEKVHNTSAVPRRPVSLDAPLPGSKDSTDDFSLLDRLSDENTSTDDAAVSDISANEIHAVILRSLEPNEMRYIARRFGLLGQEPLSRIEAASDEDRTVSDAKAAELEQTALAKLKAAFERQGINAELMPF